MSDSENSQNDGLEATKVDDGIFIRPEDSFTITAQEVLELRQRVITERDGWVAALNDETATPNLRELASIKAPDYELRVNAYEKDEDTIVEYLRGIFSMVKDLEESKVPREKIIKTISDDYLDLLKYYDLLRDHPWGYRLAQAVGAYRAEAKHNNKGL